ncbi:cupin domain-containing protein [Candidatus Micrarchaeota archaeon]|nr:cupin domain-containing protein [Candidatus Micrarchaeota archaeon]MBU1166088.1 cupin domain-containing protein [Candidatus Micrarchaeota archaeon]MBU1886664.1 cupin domain-containing protein [Candidatus Micrarchaeota archaeon]
MHISSTLKTGRIVKGEKISSGCVCLAPGEEIGVHSTECGEEILIILEGEATIEFNGNDESKKIKQDECAFVPQNTLHNIKNLSNNALRYVYVVGGKK